MTDMTTPKIGFIGLGLMGGAMVARLQDKGYDICVMGNRDRTELDKAIARGAVEAGSAREVATASDIVMICVGTSDQVEGLMRGPDGVIVGLTPGKTVIDFGTSLPASTKVLGVEVAAADCAYLDAPIGRTPQHARDGALNLMVGGDADALAKVRPVMDDLAENVFHLGGLGNGNATKLLNNFLGQNISNTLAEAYAVADHSGIDRADLHRVLSSGPLGCVFMDLMAAYALEGDASKLAFSIGNAAKDVGYYDQMIQDLGLQSVMAGAALGALRDATDQGRGDAMVSELTDYYTARFQPK
jgi:2-hydroxy-3-oxopropionate reductase